MNDVKLCQHIRRTIEQLPPMQREACLELASHIRRHLAIAGKVEAELALALIGTEMACLNNHHRAQRKIKS